MHTLFWNFSRYICQLQQCSSKLWNEFHAVQAIFFPCPTNPNTVSQSVSIWNIGKASNFSVPRLAAIPWAAKYQKIFSISKCYASKLHSCLVELHLPSLPTPQCWCLYQHYVYTSICWWPYCIELVQHVTSCNCQPIHNYMEKLSQYVPVVAHSLYL